MSVKLIYALQAHSERGKSITLKMVVLKILIHYNVDFFYSDGKKLTANDLLRQITIENQSNSYVENLYGIIKVKGKENEEKIIAVNTAGDDRWQIDKSIELFESEVDIGVCAVRTKGVTINSLNNFAEKHNLIPDNYFVINKLSLSNVYINNSAHIAMINKMNEIQANMLFDELKSLIKE